MKPKVAPLRGAAAQSLKTNIAIKMGAPKVIGPQFMDESRSSLEPGQSPPLMYPNCWQCQVPVEVFEVDLVTSPYYASLEVQCHGKTQGMRVPHDEVIALRDRGLPIWFFRGPK